MQSWMVWPAQDAAVLTKLAVAQQLGGTDSRIGMVLEVRSYCCVVPYGRSKSMLHPGWHRAHVNAGTVSTSQWMREKCVLISAQLAAATPAAAVAAAALCVHVRVR